MTIGKPAAEIGIISDTHGLIRSEARAALEGCGLILHAGDVGDPGVLEALGRIAPVHAVRGNVDVERPLRELPEAMVVRVNQVRIFMLHDLDTLDRHPQPVEVDVAVSGDTRPRSGRRPIDEDYLYPSRTRPLGFRLPVTLPEVDVILYGHTHQPMIEHIGDVLYLNPGSAGPRRFSLPVSLARLAVGGGSPRASVVQIVK